MGDEQAKTEPAKLRRDQTEVMAEHLTKKGILQGRHLVKELPFFAAEPWLVVIISMMGLGLVAIDSLGIVGVKFFGISVSAIAYAMVAASWVSMFAIKRMFYMPTGNKVILRRVYSTGGTLTSAEVIPFDGRVRFGKDELNPSAFVQRINESFDISTGRPDVTVVEGYPTNISVFAVAHEGITDKFAQKFSDTVIAAKQYGEIKARNDLMGFEGRPGKNWMMILLVVLMLVSVVTLGLTVAGMLPAPVPPVV